LFQDWQTYLLTGLLSLVLSIASTSSLAAENDHAIQIKPTVPLSIQIQLLDSPEVSSIAFQANILSEVSRQVISVEISLSDNLQLLTGQLNWIGLIEQYQDQPRPIQLTRLNTESAWIEARLTWQPEPAITMQASDRLEINSVSSSSTRNTILRETMPIGKSTDRFGEPLFLIELP